MIQFHNSPKGGHFSTKTITIEIMCVGLFWPTLFNEAYALVKSCKECQLFMGRRKNSTMSLNPIVVDEPFAQWELDFIRMINPMFSVKHRWILAAIDYFTRWTKVVPLKNSIEVEIISFLEELVTRFEPPKTIISNYTKAFLGSKVCQFSLKHGIFLKTSSNYYPQGNGLTKSTNKNLV